MDYFTYLEGISWPALALETGELRSLDSINIYCATQDVYDAEDRLSSLHTRLSKTLSGLTVGLHHSGRVSDGRHLAPDIFGFDP